MRSGDGIVSSDRMISKARPYHPGRSRGPSGSRRFSPRRPRTFQEGATNNGSLSSFPHGTV